MKYRRFTVTSLVVALFALCCFSSIHLFSAFAEPRGAAQKSGSTEEKFRARDDVIQSQFKQAVNKKQKGELSMRRYSKLVKKLQKREMRLFSDVEKYQFKDPTEYNYWHRGRMKFPSVLALEAQWLKKKEGPPPSDSMQTVN